LGQIFPIFSYEKHPQIRYGFGFNSVSTVGVWADYDYVDWGAKIDSIVGAWGFVSELF